MGGRNGSGRKGGGTGSWRPGAPERSRPTGGGALLKHFVGEGSNARGADVCGPDPRGHQEVLTSFQEIRRGVPAFSLMPLATAES